MESSLIQAVHCRAMWGRFAAPLSQDLIHVEVADLQSLLGVHLAEVYSVR